MASIANLAPMSAGEARAMAAIVQQPVAIAGGNGLVAYPDGSIGTIGGGGFGAGGSVGAATPPASTGAPPQSGNWPSIGRATSTGNWPDQNLGPQAWTSMLPQQPPNLAIRPASPVMGAPTGTMPLGGLAPSPSGGIPYGPPVPSQYGPPVPPNLAHQAARYRSAHGVAAPGDADLLNAQSLAAAQAGRTSFNPTLAGLYGGGTIPGFNVTSALQQPPASLTPQMGQNYLTALQQQTRWQPNNVNFLAGQPAYGSGLGPQY